MILTRWKIAFPFNLYQKGAALFTTPGPNLLIIIIGILPSRKWKQFMCLLLRPREQFRYLFSRKWSSKAGRRRWRHLALFHILRKSAAGGALCLMTRVLRTQNTLVLYATLAGVYIFFVSTYIHIYQQSGVLSFKFIPAKAAVHLIAAQTRAAYRLIYFKMRRCSARRFISEFGTWKTGKFWGSGWDKVCLEDFLLPNSLS